MTAFFSKFFFTNSNDGPAVGNISKIGKPIPTVCEGISPKTYPDTIETMAAKAEYVGIDTIFADLARV